MMFVTHNSKKSNNACTNKTCSLIFRLIVLTTLVKRSKIIRMITLIIGSRDIHAQLTMGVSINWTDLLATKKSKNPFNCIL